MYTRIQQTLSGETGGHNQGSNMVKIIRVSLKCYTRCNVQERAFK